VSAKLNGTGNFDDDVDIASLANEVWFLHNGSTAFINIFFKPAEVQYNLGLWHPGIGKKPESPFRPYGWRSPLNEYPEWGWPAEAQSSVL